MPSQGNTGWLAGGAVVPGRALIDVLPLVWQMVLVSPSWQVDRAPATGAEIPATTAKPATRTATLAEPVMINFPFRAAALMTAPGANRSRFSVLAPKIQRAAHPRGDEPRAGKTDRYRRAPGIPNHGNTGRLAGGAVVPGRALIDTLPLVWQMVLVAVS
jgi:hypothetical protein